MFHLSKVVKMFLGNYQSKLDISKGRTALPARFRKIIGKKAIVAQGYEGSLMMVKTDDWQEVVSVIDKGSFLSGATRYTERFILGSAFKVNFDSQGRFIIPQNLRQYAKLGKDIVFVGVGKRLEIWDKAVWQKQLSYVNKNIAQISEKLDEKLSRE